jgi:hypothetical protein
MGQGQSDKVNMACPGGARCRTLSSCSSTSLPGRTEASPAALGARQRPAGRQTSHNPPVGELPAPPSSAAGRACWRLPAQARPSCRSVATTGRESRDGARVVRVLRLVASPPGAPAPPMCRPRARNPSPASSGLGSSVRAAGAKPICCAPIPRSGAGWSSRQVSRPSPDGGEDRSGRRRGRGGGRTRAISKA